MKMTIFLHNNLVVIKAHRKVYYYQMPLEALKQVLNKNYVDFLLTVTIIMKTVIGAGILGLPYTISTLGYAFGLLVYIAVIALNQFTSAMLLKAKNLSRHSNYSTIMFHIF